MTTNADREAAAKAVKAYLNSPAAGDLYWSAEYGRDHDNSINLAIVDTVIAALTRETSTSSLSAENQKLREAVEGAVRDTLMDEYAVGDPEGISAIASAAIKAAALADCRGWTWIELDALLSRLGYARCSAVGHLGYLERKPGVTDAAKNGARSVVDAMEEAATVIGILRAALSTPSEVSNPVADNIGGEKSPVEQWADANGYCAGSARHQYATPSTGDAVREALEWFSGQHRLSLQHYSPMYGDDDDQSVEWRVHRESGSINDREWEIVGRGETALDAILAALNSQHV